MSASSADMNAVVHPVADGLTVVRPNLQSGLEPPDAPEQCNRPFFSKHVSKICAILLSL